MSANEGVTRILNRSSEQLDQAAELEKLRRNITILFTDLKGSTAFFEKFGDAAGLLMVHRCNTMLAEAVERHGGRVIKTIGDAVMAAFEDHAEAIAASIEMQEAITADNKDKTGAQKISIRIGINYGLGLVKSNDVFGDVVNVASRVESAAAPEQILISDTLYKALEGTNRFRVRPLGKFALKGKADERDLFEVRWREDGEAGPVAAHSMIVPVPDLNARVKLKLVQVRNDGQTRREFEFPTGSALMGRTQGDFTFPNDNAMQPSHARLSVESGQMFVEPVDDAVVFFSLVGPYRLQGGDVIKIGNQIVEFQVNAAALEMASMMGTGIREISAMLQHPVAEVVSTGADQKHYSVLEGQATFGRTKATYIFPTDTAMSRSHAKIYHRGEDFFIEDTGSTNGTFVLAKEKTALPEGAILCVGNQLLRVSREQ
ncbi:MAG: adenylate/guanylate cyclase, partial [Acidobacteriaceae bacterium]|nr:adenylate/guanylate cyclase [Acidobacteriaceae bacterium]